MVNDWVKGLLNLWILPQQALLKDQLYHEGSQTPLESVHEAGTAVP